MIVHCTGRYYSNDCALHREVTILMIVHCTGRYYSNDCALHNEVLF